MKHQYWSQLCISWFLDTNKYTTFLENEIQPVWWYVEHTIIAKIRFRIIFKLLFISNHHQYLSLRTQVWFLMSSSSLSIHIASSERWIIMLRSIMIGSFQQCKTLLEWFWNKLFRHKKYRLQTIFWWGSIKVYIKMKHNFKWWLNYQLLQMQRKTDYFIVSY